MGLESLRRLRESCITHRAYQWDLNQFFIRVALPSLPMGSQSNQFIIALHLCYVIIVQRLRSKELCMELLVNPRETTEEPSGVYVCTRLKEAALRNDLGRRSSTHPHRIARWFYDTEHISYQHTPASCRTRQAHNPLQSISPALL